MWDILRRLHARKIQRHTDKTLPPPTGLPLVKKVIHIEHDWRVAEQRALDQIDSAFKGGPR